MKNSYKLTGSCIALIFIFVIVFLNIHSKTPKKLITGAIIASTESKSVLGVSNSISFNFNDAALSAIINNHLPQQKGEYAIVIQSLEDEQKKGVVVKEEYLKNETTVFPSASLYKVFLLATVLQEIENGNLREDQIVTASSAHLIAVLGDKEYGYDDSQTTISYSVYDAMKRVARLSDNYASIMLAEQIGWDKVQDQVNKIGAKKTVIKAPISTTADDVALFFKKLYYKQIVSEKASDELINLLSLSEINDRIPVYLPRDIKIAHKTGELSHVRNDAGIVYLNKHPYIIVLLSKDVPFEDDAVDTLASISKDVFNYFNNK